MWTLPPEELMTRAQVARKFGVTTATVKDWVRNSQVALTEDKDSESRPRYSRTEVELLYASGFRGFESRSTASRLRRK